MKKRVRTPWAAVAAAAAGLVAAPAVPAAATVSPGAAPLAGAMTAAAPRVPVLNWTSCDDGFHCATARVPLDYRNPRGTLIRIAVIRHRATGPGKPAGSLFVNGGGPRDVSSWQSAAAQLQQLWLAASKPATPASRPAAARAGRRYGGFGETAAWQEAPCACWPAAPGKDRYAGPWNRHTATTILVIGNTGDPVTPYRSSVAMARDLARARLLTVDGLGHTEFFNPSECASNYEFSYLLTGKLPPRSTVCPQTVRPF